MHVSNVKESKNPKQLMAKHYAEVISGNDSAINQIVLISLQLKESKAIRLKHKKHQPANYLI